MGRHGTMTDHSIKSEYLQETITLKVFKPKTFSSLYKYYICIVQDGDDYFQMGRLATLSDQLHGTNQIENTVFIGIHYQDQFDRWNKYHPAGEQNEAYRKFLIHEALPLIEQIIPTYKMGKSRALMGDSLAGTVALMTALQYPHSFGKVIMHSPYVDEAVLTKIEHSVKLDLINIYHTIGTNETNVSTTDGNILNFVESNDKLNTLLQKKGCQYHFQKLSEGEHTWKYWQNNLPHALTTMFSF